MRDKLFNALQRMENRIKNYNFNNFVILNIGGNSLKLFDKELTQYKDDDNKAKNPMSSKNSIISHKTTGSKCGNAITRDEFNKEINGIKDGMNAFKTEIKNEMNLLRKEIDEIDNKIVSALKRFFIQNPSIIQSISTAPNSPEIQK